MKTNIIKFSTLLIGCFAMIGCGKEDNPTTPTVKYGTIYGTVAD